MSPRILIFGTGAVGSVYTYIFSRKVPPSNIVCICRSNYDTVNNKGITINSTIWGNDLHVHPIVVQSVSEAVHVSDESFNYIIITAKALATNPTIAEQIQPAVTPKETAIVLIQNGIRIEQTYSKLYPSNPLLTTVVYLPATQTSLGTITHKEIELLHVGTFPSNAPTQHKAAARAFTDLLTSCSATAKYHEDVQFERWSKLLVNAAWNPICALSRSHDAEFLHTSPISASETVAYVRDVMLEIAAAARACGYDEINTELVDYQIGRATKRAIPGVQPSMLADALGEKRMEVDAIVGNTLKIAKEKGIDAPLLRGLYVLLSALDGSFVRAAAKRDGRQ